MGATRDVAEAAELLVAHGVPAARRPRSALDVRPSAAAGARASTRMIDHPVVGPLADADAAVPLRVVDRWLRTPAPTLGQHNHEILVDELGVDEATYAALEAAQVIGTRPKGL